MDTETFIEYEVIEPISNKSFITSIREEALEHFENHCMVYEYHNTITQITAYTQSLTRITMQWHLNPTFEPNN